MVAAQVSAPAPGPHSSRISHANQRNDPPPGLHDAELQTRWLF